MVKVSVKAEQGRFFSVVHNDRINYTLIGRVFEAGEPVNGKMGGEVRAEQDAADWREKFLAAGIEAE